MILRAFWLIPREPNALRSSPFSSGRLFRDQGQHSRTRGQSGSPPSPLRILDSNSSSTLRTLAREYPTSRARCVSTVLPSLRIYPETSPALGLSLLRREYQPALAPSHLQLQQQIRQMTTEVKRQIRRSPLQCCTTTAPMARGFSCDWDNWDCGSFIRTMPRFTKITRVEFLFHRIYEQTGTIKPLACNVEGHDPRLVLEARGNYYFWDGTWGNLYRWAKEEFQSGEEFLLRFNDADVREGRIVPAPSEERYAEIADATSLENPRP